VAKLLRSTAAHHCTLYMKRGTRRSRRTSSAQQPTTGCSAEKPELPSNASQCADHHWLSPPESLGVRCRRLGLSREARQPGCPPKHRTADSQTKTVRPPRIRCESNKTKANRTQKKASNKARTWGAGQPPARCSPPTWAESWEATSASTQHAATSAPTSNTRPLRTRGPSPTSPAAELGSQPWPRTAE